ncbi:MAG: DNA adenine methylase [Cyanobacteria bacterium]|nr:DNA adenine methylase [Cyanobacteriota bacterium]
MKASPSQFKFSALPSYMGGKRRLVHWIFKTLTQAVPCSLWSQSTFIDLFMGGGSVSFWAKAQGFQKVIANDLSFRSQILAQAFLCNQRVKLTHEELVALTQVNPKIPGFVEQNFATDVFSTRHARALDQCIYGASQTENPVKRSLILALAWHLANDFVAFPTSLGTSNRPFAEAIDGKRNWDDLNPKRFNDGSLRRLCQPTWKQLEAKGKLINAGVFGGAPVEVFQEDAISLLPQLRGDILYLDPPYAGTVNYERNNQVLDAILRGEIPTHKPEISAFSKTTDHLNFLLDQAQHIPVWLLSYGNQHLDLEGLIALVKDHAQGRNVQGFAKNYQHLPHVSRTTGNQELLIIAYPTGGI